MKEHLIRFRNSFPYQCMWAKPVIAQLLSARICCIIHGVPPHSATRVTTGAFVEDVTYPSYAAPTVTMTAGSPAEPIMGKYISF